MLLTAKEFRGVLDTISFEARDHTLLVIFFLKEAVGGLLKPYRYIVLLMVTEPEPPKREASLLMAVLGFSLLDIHLGDC